MVCEFVLTVSLSVWSNWAQTRRVEEVVSTLNPPWRVCVWSTSIYLNIFRYQGKWW